MRKWLVIGVALLSFGGILFYAVLRDRNSIEYHKKEYLKASGGWTWSDEFRRMWDRAVGNVRTGHRQVTASEIRRMERHRKSLIDLGYLESRIFVVSNRPPSLVARVVRFSCAGLSYEFGEPEPVGPNLVGIIAVRGEMPKWEQLIRDADVPPKSKSD